MKVSDKKYYNPAKPAKPLPAIILSVDVDYPIIIDFYEKCKFLLTLL